MKFSCPNCTQKLQAEPGHVGRTVRCPMCNNKLVVPPDPDAPAETFARPPAKKKQIVMRNAAPPPAAPAAAGRSAEIPASPGPAAQPSPGAPRATGAYRERPASRQREDSTNVAQWKSFLIGLGLTVAAYLLLAIDRKSYVSVLLMDRGWVCYAEALLAGWAFGFLILKWRKIQRQRQAMLLNVLPTEISEDITGANVDRFLENIDRLPAHLHESFMVNRMRHGLAHFKVRRSNPEVASMMMAQSEMDASAIHSSYSLLKIFIWAIPILGFIGTVQGISDAVNGFSSTLDKAGDIETLRKSLNGITGGLAVAFDTTLVALVLSLAISFPASATQKKEEDLLTWVDEYCNENLLKRLSDAAGAVPGANVPADQAGLVAAVLSGQQAFTAALHGVAERFEKLREEQGRLAGQMAEATSGFARDAHAARDEAVRAVRQVGEGLGALNQALTELGRKQLVFQKPIVTRSFALISRPVAEKPPVFKELE